MLVNNRQFGLIGYPLSHSFSRVLHEAALNDLDLHGQYDLIEIAPDRDQNRNLDQVLQKIRNGKFQGLNVTIPHKQNVISLLDDLTPIARQAGAVNSIYLKNDVLMGDNTDIPGFKKDFEANFGLEHDLVIILGAGGAARAVIHALGNLDINLWLAVRNPDKARQMLKQICTPKAKLQVLDLNPEALNSIPDGKKMLINTTPVGMSPQIDLSPWPVDLDFPQQTDVYDLIYNPQETLLMKQAKQAGNRAENGLGMFLEQGLLAFQCWTEQMPESGYVLIELQNTISKLQEKIK